MFDSEWNDLEFMLMMVFEWELLEVLTEVLRNFFYS